jgi:hypothetical protein
LAVERWSLSAKAATAGNAWSLQSKREAGHGGVDFPRPPVVRVEARAPAELPLAGRLDLARRKPVRPEAERHRRARPGGGGHVAHEERPVGVDPEAPVGALPVVHVDVAERPHRAGLHHELAVDGHRGDKRLGRVHAARVANAPGIGEEGPLHAHAHGLRAGRAREHVHPALTSRLVDVEEVVAEVLQVRHGPGDGAPSACREHRAGEQAIAREDLGVVADEERRARAAAR